MYTGESRWLRVHVVPTNVHRLLSPFLFRSTLHYSRHVYFLCLPRARVLDRTHKHAHSLPLSEVNEHTHWKTTSEPWEIGVSMPLVPGKALEPHPLDKPNVWGAGPAKKAASKSESGSAKPKAR